MLRPRCRYCPVYVRCFGDICWHCQESGTPNDDLIRLVNMDLAKLREKADG